MRNQILVTGAGGYIGTTLVPMLLMAGYRVRAVDTWWFGKRLPNHPELEIYTADVRTMQKELFAGASCVVDLAALSNDPCGEAFSEATRDINYHARARTASMASEAGAKHYILASSCSVYGHSHKILDEESETNPLTVYAQANLDAEKYILSLARQKFRVTALRFATLFGVSPRMRLDLVVNGMSYNAWRHGEIAVDGAGTQMRPLLHVKDAAEAVFRTIRRAERFNCADVVNIGNPALNISINDIASGIAEHLMKTRRRTIEIRHRGPQDLRSYAASFGKLQATLSWLPSRSWATELDGIFSFLEKASNLEIRQSNTLDYYRDLINQQRIDQAFRAMPQGLEDDLNKEGPWAL